MDTTGGLTAGRLLQMLEAETSSREEQVSGNQRAFTGSTTSQPQQGWAPSSLEGWRTLMDRTTVVDIFHCV